RPSYDSGVSLADPSCGYVKGRAAAVTLPERHYLAVRAVSGGGSWGTLHAWRRFAMRLRPFSRCGAQRRRWPSTNRHSELRRFTVTPIRTAGLSQNVLGKVSARLPYDGSC